MRDDGSQPGKELVMDQKKIGSYLKELRKEKGITQEQFAEIFGVSGRTVSRWETGSNMPDLGVLIEIADYYGIELRDLLVGERRSEKMNKEMKETVLKVADYSNEEKKKLSKRMCVLFIAGAILFTIYVVLETFFVTGTSIGPFPVDGPLISFCKGFALGFAYSMMIAGVLYTSGCLAKIKAYKKRLMNRIFTKLP